MKIMKLMRATLLPVLLLTLLLGACSFHLRGKNILPVEKLYVRTNNEFSPFIIELKHALEVNGVQLANSPEVAQLTLHIVSEIMDKQILSLSGGGRVREYRLQFLVSLRAYDLKQQDWLAPSEISLRRDFSYDDTQILSKEQEENLLQKNLRSDAVQQVVRRLAHAKPPQPSP
jgi:LPS-assembly lipoprotein